MKNKFAFLIFIFLFTSILTNFVCADIGPKPTVDIDVLYEGNKISDENFNAKMLECNEFEGFPRPRDLIPQLNISEYDSTKNCSWIPAYLAWGGDCQNSRCDFMYMPPTEFKLAVYIPSLDKVFISNEISRTYFNSKYEVNLKSDGSAIIHDTTPSETVASKSDKNISFTSALFITCLIEMLVAVMYLSITKLPKKILISVLVGSLITLPIVWFVFPLIKIISLVIISSEIFAIVFEAYFIYCLNKQAITLKKSFILSTIMNLASLIIGGFIAILLIL